MGFMDKMKTAAQDAATQAKKATAGAQTKMEEGQVKKKMDESAKKLGYLVYAERTQGTPAGADADTAVSELQGLEQKLKELQTQAAETPAASPEASAPAAADPAAAPPPSTPTTSSSEPTGGDFKL
jgi:ribosomal protein L12E/L44/L45/RPP1/RPP2